MEETKIEMEGVLPERKTLSDKIIKIEKAWEDIEEYKGDRLITNLEGCKLEDVKQALKELIDWFNTETMRRLKLSEIEEKIKEIFGERLV